MFCKKVPPSHCGHIRVRDIEFLKAAIKAINRDNNRSFVNLYGGSALMAWKCSFMRQTLQGLARKHYPQEASPHQQASSRTDSQNNSNIAAVYIGLCDLHFMQACYFFLWLPCHISNNKSNEFYVTFSPFFRSRRMKEGKYKNVTYDQMCWKLPIYVKKVL